MHVQAFTFNGFQENTYVLYDDTLQAVIVDPGCYDRREQQQLVRFITDKKLTVIAVWNTHCHIDHVMGNAFCCRTFGVPLAAHKEEVFTLSMAERSAQMYGFDAYEPSPDPTRWFADGDVLKLGELEISVIFGPGHAVGHVAFYHAPSSQIIAGDILFKGSFGRVDLPGGSMEVLKKTIHERMFTLPENTVVYSGHGPATTIGEEKKTNYIWQF